jgi:hypothetical protein
MSVNMNLIYCFSCFLLLHIGVWFSANLQLVNNSLSSRSFMVMLCLAFPTSILAYYGTKFGFAAFSNSAWSVRFFAFAVSYLVFPILTWWFLGESIFTVKTALCIILSIVILLIQLYM